MRVSRDRVPRNGASHDSISCDVLSRECFMFLRFT